jgi:formate/nitrite transporter FocA (FNT family)
VGFFNEPESRMNTGTDRSDSSPSKVTLRSVFEHAACGLGIVAAIATGLADQGSALQASSAIVMGTAFGTAYILKR